MRKMILVAMLLVGSITCLICLKMADGVSRNATPEEMKETFGGDVQCYGYWDLRCGTEPSGPDVKCSVVISPPDPNKCFEKEVHSGSEWVLCGDTCVMAGASANHTCKLTNPQVCYELNIYTKNSEYSCYASEGGNDECEVYHELWSSQEVQQLDDCDNYTPS